ncbi:Crp/Fnr family transcriptional regulator [Ferruginibacter sp. HRS2-29]|uniref:Crp/Fnr family transcriptional regulator n=1 Tax=Ferruginibacter sp. HRS2-29 TaxID=2487334 RepID=UPI0020CD6201|nr:Crp/Fnr family transcriptional regulator [Ferruginibacter sp. HRS2-29]MCP9751157.1 Crp/Fnr family transcriptional regulator [Ferruginibacter sp. HRS2-29]
MKKNEQKEAAAKRSLELITNFFNQIHPLTDDLIRELATHTFPLSVEKGKLLVKPSEENKFFYFIVKGVVRSFIRQDAKEITTWINIENSIVSSIRNLGIKTWSGEYLQTLEACDLIAIPADALQRVYDTYPEANFYGRIIIEDCYRSSEERAYISRIPSALKRLKHFENTHGFLLNRIPLKYIASYLGITLETLSRLRAKK